MIGLSIILLSLLFGLAVGTLFSMFALVYKILPEKKNMVQRLMLIFFPITFGCTILLFAIGILFMVILLPVSIVEWTITGNNALSDYAIMKIDNMLEIINN